MPDNAGRDTHKPPSLEGIALTASLNKTHRFRNLDGELTPEILLTAWMSINKDAASGVDKMTAEDYREKLLENIEDLAQRLKEKRYKAKLVRRTYIKEWIRLNRHKPKRWFFKTLNAKLQGHYKYYGVRGNSRSLWEFYDEVMKILFKWLNRRSQRKSYHWEAFKRLLMRIRLAKPRITESKRLHSAPGGLLRRTGTEASTTEEPREGKLHAGSCAGGAGRPAFLPRRGVWSFSGQITRDTCTTVSPRFLNSAPEGICL